MREIEYRPQNIRETLVELKDSSELAVDLAYSAVLFDNHALANEVLELESRANFLQYHARIALMLAAKNTADAESLVGIFQVVDGAVAITEAAADIARVPLEEMGIPSAFRALPDAHERFVRVEIGGASSLAGHPLSDLDLDVDEAVRVIAVRRGAEWVFDPEGDDELRTDDVVFARGPDEGIDAFYEAATGEVYEPPAAPANQDLEDAIEAVVELKNVSELAIGLSYSAALYDSDALAEEVQALAARADELREDLEQWVVAGPERGGDDGGEQLRGLFHVTVAAEVICDAALDIADVVFREVELHPVFARAIRESKEVITSIELGAESDIVGRTVDALEHDIETGMTVLALRREAGWQYDPDDGTTFRAGDRLVLKGPQRGESRLRRLAD